MAVIEKMIEESDFIRKRQAVDSFYRELAFNIHSSPDKAAEIIRRRNQIFDAYPDLHRILSNTSGSFLDVGCGTGWLANSVSYHYGIETFAIDANPVALDFAREVAHRLGVRVVFEGADLFSWNIPAKGYDIVASIGVLHHTPDIERAIGQVTSILSHHDSARLYLALYHRYGRQPFLRHFQDLRARGATEDDLFSEFRRLNSGLEDEKLLQSWFRDQVLHPHETVHSLRELLPVLASVELAVESTSLDGYAPTSDTRNILRYEPRFEQIAQNALECEGRYFPGMFTLCLRRKGTTRS